MRKTKIIATIGPASREPEMLERLFRAGVDFCRLNFSHGTIEEHVNLIKTIRAVSAEVKLPVGILQDLGGNKLRLGELGETYYLNDSDTVTLVAEERVAQRGVLPFPHPMLLDQMRAGDLIYVADGTITLEILTAGRTTVTARVQKGGLVSSHKGVNIPNLRIDQPVMTQADRLAIKAGVEHGVDWLAVSFVRNGADLQEVRRFVKESGGSMPLVAKLERAVALEHLDEILAEADAIMVARGDLGIETPMEAIPVLQKEIVKKANNLGKPCIVATQMLRTMLTSSMPTRAEISDIATAVLDGADAVMLSEETAMGQYPVHAVEVMQTTIGHAEGVYPFHRQLPANDRTQAIAAAAASLVEATHSRLIVITSTGRAAFQVARYRPRADLLVLAHEASILQRTALAWGVCPLAVIPRERDVPMLMRLAIRAAMQAGRLGPTDVVTIVHGFLTGVSGTTSSVQVLDLKEYPWNS